MIMMGTTRRITAADNQQENQFACLWREVIEMLVVIYHFIEISLLSGIIATCFRWTRVSVGFQSVKSHLFESLPHKKEKKERRKNWQILFLFRSSFLSHFLVLPWSDILSALPAIAPIRRRSIGIGTDHVSIQILHWSDSYQREQTRTHIII